MKATSGADRDVDTDADHERSEDRPSTEHASGDEGRRGNGNDDEEAHATGYPATLRALPPRVAMILDDEPDGVGVRQQSTTETPPRADPPRSSNP